MKLLKMGLIALTTLSLAACGDNATQEAASSEKSSSAVESQQKETFAVVVSLEQDGKEVEGATKEVKVEEETTVLELLKEQYEVVEKDGFIVSVEGMEQDEEARKYWMYEVNEEEPTVGAAEYIVNDGDQVKWFLNALQ